MAYKLVDHGYPYKKIMHGKRWIGRVCRHINGNWFGVIGSLMVNGTSERDAFEQVVAKHLGYADASALHARNRQARAQRRVARSTAKHVLNSIIRGDFRPLDELFTRMEEEKRS